ncbi:hypothetical protein SAMN05192583_0602 [Sphingomonas gellani]|uniref:Uncharacterized protein n=1 Tax=Sphingomonas gellani TaxID=1166340 RepID=A0A1H7ZAD7_9SPHN|nr:hypothetical protein [Sphingomonas gellani]SEM55296.1 hypothetical protein SAMN05192583_0602 [Sphingomonas gellani]
MTHTDPSGPVPVTQADRDAAADIYRRFRYGATVEIQAQIRRGIERGKSDDDPIVQVFARHRLSSGSDVVTVPSGWPDIGVDPLKAERPNDRLEASIEACRKAYVQQQREVPSQTALVWRWHLGSLLEAATRLKALRARNATAPTPTGEGA